MLVMFSQNICALFSEYVLVFLQASAGKYQIQTEKAQSQLDKTQTDYDRLQEKFERGQNEIRKVSPLATFLPNYSFLSLYRPQSRKIKTSICCKIYTAHHISVDFFMLIREKSFFCLRLVLDQKLFSTIGKETFLIMPLLDRSGIFPWIKEFENS